ncbi:hypothetical protein MMC25_000986 [Agyrium rufum]|nr:hypothetical protein [Agyrium rufum]
MADPLSVSSGIAGLLALSGSILSKGYQYVTAVKDAPRNLRHLLRETSALDTLLDQLLDLSSSKSAALHKTALQSLVDGNAIRDCTEILQSLDKVVSSCAQVPGQTTRNLGKAMIWPLKDSSAQKLLAELTRMKDTFTTALAVDAVHALQRVDAKTNEILDSVTQLQITKHKEKEVKRQQETLAWLCPFKVDMSGVLETILHLRQSGTGEWFLRSKHYQSWKQSFWNTILWISSTPGCGKTVLAATVIDHLRSAVSLKKEDDAVIYVFFGHGSGNQEIHSTSDLLDCIIHQLVQHNPSCREDLEGVQKQIEKRKGSKPIQAEKLAILQAMCLRVEHVYLVVDALDECPDVVSFIQEIVGLLEQVLWLGDVLRILITSRPSREIERILFPHLSSHMNLNRMDGLQLDIHHYVQAEVSCRIETGVLKVRNESLKKEIVEQLSRGADHMFLWARIQLEQLSSLRSDKAIKAALQSLPRGLDETYIKILYRMKEENEDNLDELKSLLRWLVINSGPLSFAQLAEAISISPADTARDVDAILTDPLDIMGICGSLITIHSDPGKEANEQSTVQLAHLSIRDYLTSSRIKNSSVAELAVDIAEADAIAAETCLQYIGFSDFSGPYSSVTQQRSLFSAYRFLRYACCNWTSHLVSATSTGVSLHRFLPRLTWFLYTGEPSWNYVIWERFRHESSVADGVYAWDFTLSLPQVNNKPLHYHPLCWVAILGLDAVADYLLEQGTDPDTVITRIDYRVTALHVAAGHGNVTLAKILLNHGATVDMPKWPRKTTALHIAAENGHADMIRVLLGANASVHKLSTSGASAFYRSARGGSIEVMRMLYEAGSNIDIRTHDDWTALHEAVEMGHGDVLDLLLGWNANPLVANSYGQTAFRTAVAFDHHAMASILFSHILKLFRESRMAWPRASEASRLLELGKEFEVANGNKHLMIRVCCRCLAIARPTDPSCNDCNHATCHSCNRVTTLRPTAKFEKKRYRTREGVLNQSRHVLSIRQSRLSEPVG